MSSLNWIMEHCFKASITLLIIFVFPAHATTLTVSSISDNGPATLRAVIAEAAPGDTIEFDAAIAGQIITLDSEILIDKDITLSGQNTILDGASSTRHFTITDGTTTVDSIVFQNGNAGLDPLTFDLEFSGGSIRIGENASLEVSNSSFAANRATYGGAIESKGSVNLNNVTIANSQGIFGGAIMATAGQVDLSGTLFVSNEAIFSERVGIIDLTDVSATIVNTTITGNTRGVAISTQRGSLSLKHTTIVNNQGAGIRVDNQTLDFGFNIIANNALYDISYTGESGDTTNRGGSVFGFLEADTSFLFSLADSRDVSEPGLMDLADNGCVDLQATPNGLACIQTHALTPESIAFNAAGNSTGRPGSDQVIDQRGISRSQGFPDSGAFELEIVCPSDQFDIANPNQFSVAMTCYNRSTSGTTTVNIQNDITIGRQTKAVINNASEAELIINGNNHLIDANFRARHFLVMDGKVTINNSILQNGQAGFIAPISGPIDLPDSEIQGGALSILASADVSIINSSLVGNQANEGGSIYTEGRLSVQNSTIRDSDAIGGPIVSQVSGSSEFLNTTISNNIGGFSPFNATSAVRVFGEDSTARFVNTTISLNNAGVESKEASLSFIHSTVAFNNSGVRLRKNAVARFESSLIVDLINDEPNFFDQPTVETGGFNVFSGSAQLVVLGEGDIINPNPFLSFGFGALTDNGCEVQHATQSGPACVETLAIASDPDERPLAFNRVTEATIASDQRGVTRPQGAASDSGAYEVVLLSATPSTALIDENGGSVEVTVTRSHASSFPLALTVLDSSFSNRFNLPDDVVIPAGETQITFAVTALDDDLAEPDFEAVIDIRSGTFVRDRIGVTIVNDDFDLDNDLILDRNDNCPVVANPSQADFDADGLGDACDTDDDNDGLSDRYELENGLDPFDASDRDADPDGDGFTNREEFGFGTDPQVANPDVDNDGVPDDAVLRTNLAPVLDLLLLED